MPGLSITICYLSIYGGVVEGGGGGPRAGGAPTTPNQIWGGPACKSLRTPAIGEERVHTSLSPIQTHRDTQRHTQRHTQRQTHTQTHPHADTPTHQPHTHTHTHTQTHTHTHRGSLRPISLLVDPSPS